MKLNYLPINLFLCVSAVSFIMLSGCSLKHCDEYEYFHFINDEAKVTEIGVPDLYGLNEVSAMPLQYMISRIEYDLEIKINQSAYGPSVKLALKSIENESLLTISIPSMLEKNPECFSLRTESDFKVISWAYNGGCDDINSLIIIIIDLETDSVYSEKLLFDIKNNGSYCVWDL